MNFLNLIRWKNLLLIALTQYLIKYALLLPFDVSITLNDLGFSLLVFATLCIAAAGYIINDIYDTETDLVNRPERVIVGKSISEKAAYNLFFALNIIGVGLGFYLANTVGRSGFFAVFIIISALLYVYSSYLKQLPVVGNIVISMVVASSILIVGLFELLPVINEGNRNTQITFFNILFDYAVFAFMITLIRELVKDIEDVDGDHKAGLNTLPIAIGRARATNITFIASLIPTMLVSYYVITYLYKQQIAVGYFLVFIIAPMIYVSIKLFSAETKTQYHHISVVLKIVMFFGILSLLLYRLILA